MQEPESRQGYLHVGIRVRRGDDVTDGLDAGPYEVYAAGWNDRSCEDKIEWGGGLHGADYAPAVGATGYVRIIDQPPDQALGAESSGGRPESSGDCQETRSTYAEGPLRRCPPSRWRHRRIHPGPPGRR